MSPSITSAPHCISAISLTPCPDGRQQYVGAVPVRVSPTGLLLDILRTCGIESFTAFVSAYVQPFGTGKTFCEVFAKPISGDRIFHRLSSERIKPLAVLFN